MHFGTARKLAVRSTAVFVVALGACSDPRLDKLTAGIDRDSALKVINEGATGDSLARVYKQESYLIDGKQLNVLFYNKDGVRQADDSALAAKEQTPIVVFDDKVTGWGWAFYDSVAKANNISQQVRK